MSGLHCACGASISARSKTGRCQPCANRAVNSDPAVKAARAEGIRRKWASDPEFAERMKREATKRIIAPEVQAKNRERFFRTQPWRYSKRDEESYRRGGEAISAARLSHIPPELRGQYMRLVRSKRMLAKDAAAIVLKMADAHHAPLAADFLRRLTSVSRCDANGNYSPTGSHWKYGTVIKDAADLVALARRKGWQPERWAA